MNDKVYSEFVDVAGSSIQIFAMQLDTDKLVWSIGSTTHSVAIQMGDTTKDSVKTLKQMRKSIDGAIKFMNGRQKQINVEKGKKNDESKK